MRIAGIETFCTPRRRRCWASDRRRRGGLGPGLALQRRHHRRGPPPPDRAPRARPDRARHRGLVDLIADREHKFPGSYVWRALCRARHRALGPARQARGQERLRASRRHRGRFGSTPRACGATSRPRTRRSGWRACATATATTPSRSASAASAAMTATSGRAAPRRSCRRSRKALGDVWRCSWTRTAATRPARAIEVGRMLEDHGVCHFEEPCPYWELEWTRRSPTRSTSPVTGGEQECELDLAADDRDARGRRRAAGHLLSRRPHPHAARRGDGAGSRPAGHPTLRQPLDGLRLHPAHDGGDRGRGALRRVLDRGPPTTIRGRTASSSRPWSRATGRWRSRTGRGGASRSSRLAGPRRVPGSELD